MQEKVFVLDTNVLLQSPGALFAFEDNTVVLPEAVLEELDSFKKDQTEIGYCARTAIRLLDELREQGKLTEGVETLAGGRIRIEGNHADVALPANWQLQKADNRILQVCKALQDQGQQVFLVTKDIVQRIKAEVLDVVAQDYLNERTPSPEQQYTGRLVTYMSSAAINSLYEKKRLRADARLKLYDENGARILHHQFVVNQFLEIRSCDNTKHSALARFNGKEIVCLQSSGRHPYGVKPRNAGQCFLIEALLQPVEDVPLVIAKGPAGTAKTFLSLAAGLELVIGQEGSCFRRILACRPNVLMDEEIGFLPGDEKQKIAPLMRPILDNLEILVDSSSRDRYSDEGELASKVHFLLDQGIIVSEAVAFLRGRSIARHYVIIDEAQNLTPKQVKAIITRVGESTKLVLLGDPGQIDHPFLDARTNGLVYAAEKMKGSPYCCQITFHADECVRSALAMEGSALL